MTQTTDGMSFADADVSIQITGDAQPTDISGFATAVEVSGFELQTGEAYTGDANTSILTAGKISPGEVTVRVIYTEGTTDPTAEIFDAFKEKTKMKVLWLPSGAGAGNFKWETSEGYITTCTPPGGEYGSADAILFEFTLRCSDITRTVSVS